MSLSNRNPRVPLLVPKPLFTPCAAHRCRYEISNFSGTVGVPPCVSRFADGNETAIRRGRIAKRRPINDVSHVAFSFLESRTVAVTGRAVREKAIREPSKG